MDGVAAPTPNYICSHPDEYDLPEVCVEQRRYDPAEACKRRRQRFQVAAVQTALVDAE